MKTLLLSPDYEVISFISEKKAIKFLLKDKVEVLSFWEEVIYTNESEEIYLPATLRLKNLTRWIPTFCKYSSLGVFRRDQYLCQYCGETLTNKTATIDHVKPRSQGGLTSWHNCVTACFECNNYKGNRTPEEVKMQLISKPYVPNFVLQKDYQFMSETHPDWSMYLRRN